MCETGRRLKEAREAQGRSLAEMAQQLSVRKVILEALEECRYEELPEAALSRGYLRRYAQILGLDPEPLLAEFPAKTGSRAANPTGEAAPPRRGLPIWFWTLLLLILIGAGVAAWRLFTIQNKPTTVEVAPPPPPAAPQRVTLRVTTQPPGARVYLDGFLLGQSPVQAPGIEVGERVLRIEAPGFKPYQTTLRLTENKDLSVVLEVAPPPPAASNPSPTPANPQTTPPAATPPTNTPSVVLRLEGRSWVRVTTANGQKLYEGIPAQGAVLTYSQPVVVRAGNPAAVRVSVNGQDQGVMGQPGQPITRRYPASP